MKRYSLISKSKLLNSLEFESVLENEVSRKYNFILLLHSFYRRYIKKHSKLRSIVIFLWVNLCPLLIKTRLFFLSSKSQSWKDIVKLKDSSDNVIKDIVASCNIVYRPPPVIFGINARKFPELKEDFYIYPEIYIATLNNYYVCGKTNLLVNEKKIICHDLYDFETDLSSEELHNRILINRKFSLIRYLKSGVPGVGIDKAAVFLDACSSNYAHWLTEVLPRIATFCAAEKYSNIPIIVDRGLHPNIMESLVWVVGSSRLVITLDKDQSLGVKELYVTSVCGYVPYGPRNNNKSANEGLFSPYAFNRLLARLSDHISTDDKCEWPKKIYLKRNSLVRNLINCNQIEKVLLAFGYNVIEPEKLTFLQQVKLFQNAESIVGSSGAALANIIFCKKSTNVLILIPEYKNTLYLYWQNIACAVGVLVTYILGDLSKKKPMGIHSDFYINPDELVSALKAFEKS